MSAEKQRLSVLNRLSAEYPASVSLEELRKDTALNEADFRRTVAYLEEKALIDVIDLKEGVGGVFGEARITASGLDFVECSARRVRASWIR